MSTNETTPDPVLAALIAKANELEAEASRLWAEFKAIEEDIKPHEERVIVARGKWSKAFEQANALNSLIKERSKGAA